MAVMHPYLFAGSGPTPDFGISRMVPYPPESGAVASRPAKAANSATSTPDLFPFIFRWKTSGRKGQFCRVLEYSGAVHICRVEFQDGHQMDTSRNAVIRRKTCRTDAAKGLHVNSVTKEGRGESPEPEAEQTTAHLAPASQHSASVKSQQDKNQMAALPRRNAMVTPSRKEKRL